MAFQRYEVVLSVEEHVRRDNLDQKGDIYALIVTRVENRFGRTYCTPRIDGPFPLRDLDLSGQTIYLVCPNLYWYDLTHVAAWGPNNLQDLRTCFLGWTCG